MKKVNPGAKLAYHAVLYLAAIQISFEYRDAGVHAFIECLKFGIRFINYLV